METHVPGRKTRTALDPGAKGAAQPRTCAVCRNGTGRLRRARLAHDAPAGAGTRPRSHGPVPLRRKPAALLDGVSELVLGELATFPDDPDWQSQLRRIAHDLRDIALRHPNVVPLLVTRPLSTPLGLPRLLRVPLRPHPQRTAGVHRRPRGKRSPPPSGPAPAATQGLPPHARRGPGPRRLRRDG